jgi:RNA polymerase sigma-54 factor
MRQGLTQSARMGQELRINPRLYQAMDMLTMPLLDLQQHLKQELEQNPFLDLVEPDEDEGEEDGEGGDRSADTVTSDADAPEPAPDPERDESSAWEDFLLEGFEDGSRGLSSGSGEAPAAPEPVRVAGRDLTDHLREQVALLELSERQRVLAEEFLGNIDEDGFLSCSLDALLEGLNAWVLRLAEQHGRGDEVPLYTLAEAEAMLAVVQGLDPAGVGARDMRECLLLQLRELGRSEALAARLVAEAFDELVSHRWTDLARRYGVPPTDIQAAADEVARLDPKPGARFAVPDEGFVIPDLLVERAEDGYRVSTNDLHMPRLRLARAYEDLARSRRTLDAEQREFIQSRFNAAQWLVQAIEQRRQTMLKVTAFIVDRQRDFLDKGIDHLKPLTLREVAEVVGLHESTISRVTSDKYVQTPRGVLPLKFFFSSGLATADGDDVSARGIKAQIARLVGDEDPKAPLTDQDLVDRLQQTGVRIARRTVAKYRDQLGILPTRLRKRV